MPRCKKKVAVLVCVTCCLLLFLNSVVVLKLSGTSVSEQGGDSHGHPFQDFGESGQAHFSALRKRLNKSNYTSDTSPEGDIVGDQDSEKFNYQPIKLSEDGTHKLLDGKSSYTDPDVDDFLRVLNRINNASFPFSVYDKVPYLTFLNNYRKESRKKGFGLPVYKNYKGVTNWERFHMGIHQYGMYSPDDTFVDDLLKDLATLPIVDIEQKEGGTQLKLITTFNDEGQALFKPQRFTRAYQTPPDHFYFVDFERHNAEVAAFHLDRVLGFHRIPPTAGRRVNITRDLKDHADHKLAKTFFVSPAGNICFHGSCSYYCDTTHAICGRPDTVESSLATFLPPEKIADRKTWRNPWKRSYSKHRKAYWEVYDDLCDKVRIRPPYNSGRRLLDIMDMAIFDFITGNMDRHHYETFQDFGNDTFIMHLDNGRAFGKVRHDEMSILTPVSQCCLVRHSTFMKLVKMYRGPDSLSSVLKSVMVGDMIRPVLTDPFLDALDRRVMKILQVVMDCIKRRGQPYKAVIVDDKW